MTDNFLVMALSVVISVTIMLYFAGTISDDMTENPGFEIPGLFVLLLIGFVLILEGRHIALLTSNQNTFPYISPWIIIFILMLIFTVNLCQNWVERKRKTAPITLRRKQNLTIEEE